MKTSAQGQSFLDSLFPPVSLYLEQSLGSSKASTDICGVNEQMTEPPNTRVMGGAVGGDHVPRREEQMLAAHRMGYICGRRRRENCYVIVFLCDSVPSA